MSDSLTREEAETALLNGLIEGRLVFKGMVQQFDGTNNTITGAVIGFNASLLDYTNKEKANNSLKQLLQNVYEDL